MSTTMLARSVSATPKRSAAETWSVIVGIIAPDPNDPARDDLIRISGVAASIIAADTPKTDPIVVFGGGPRLRVYCLYNDDALLDDRASEDPVRQPVTGDGWHVSLPCEEEDLVWVQQRLATLSSRITARKLGEKPPSEEAHEDSSATVDAGRVIDMEEFFRS